MSSNRILYVPGKNSKPPAEVHHGLLLRCLVEGVARHDSAVADAIRSDEEHFELIAWNYFYYRRHQDITPELRWIDEVLRKPWKPEDVTARDLAELMVGSELPVPEIRESTVTDHVVIEAVNAAACAAVIRRGLAANTKPRASAPASTAAASSGRRSQLMRPDSSAGRVHRRSGERLRRNAETGRRSGRRAGA